MALMPHQEPDGDEAPAPGGAAPQPQPSGSSPATQPSVNNGMQAAGMAQLGMAIRVLERSLPMLGSGSEAGSAVLKAISSLTKFAAASDSSPGIAMNAAQNVTNQMRQNMPMIAAMRAQGGGAPQPGQPPKPLQAPPQA